MEAAGWRRPYKAAGARRGGGISSCLECRNRRRRVVLDARIARSENDAGQRRRPSDAFSRRLTEVSSMELGAALPAICACSHPSLFSRYMSRLGVGRTEASRTRTRKGRMPYPSDNGDQESDFDLEESKAERDSHRRSRTESELEGFFAAAEGELRRRFADRYNFDVAGSLLASCFPQFPFNNKKKSIHPSESSVKYR
ncbi:uncharacterized protein LOC121973632 isoform X1 [Zingiber officinale]|uniref:uncharacterized protein LOC121973632 isoform X1 n=1 Tax=Zingiber officinale TaxID=94328 RepID=UPI001C4AC25F|nr:uncharacterized protein LOC121973632 isoform X1 [Zingiber officinale]